MSTLKIQAGDFTEGNFTFSKSCLFIKGSCFFMLKDKNSKAFRAEKLEAGEIAELQEVSEENVKHLGIAAGLVGGLLFGGLGALGGLILGGKKKEVLFYAKFKDGRQLVATLEEGLYKELEKMVPNNVSKYTEMLSN
jgi:hypothetical protein